MTLSTTILILDPHPPEPLFRFGRALLGCEDHHTWEDRPAREESWGHQDAVMANHLGQGLPAIFKVNYATDAPIRRLGDPEPDEEIDPEDEPGRLPHCLRVWMDTAYGYREGLANCGDLHAWMVLEIGLWCEERNLRYWWYRESAGTWHDSMLDVHTFGDPEVGRLRPTPIDLPPLPPMTPRYAEAAAEQADA